MPKFFVDINNINAGKITIAGEDFNHIKKVLRLRCGDNIIVCDGKGYDMMARIDEFQSEKLTAAIVSSAPSKSEPPVEIVLFQGIPKSDKMDFVIQKSVEIGISKIVPVITDRTIVRIDNQKDALSKVTRWNRISLEAAKQCNRGIVPEIGFPVVFDAALEYIKEFDLSLIPYERENEIKLRDCLGTGSVKKVSVLIGPEGGFTEEEIERAVAAGVRPVTLGPRILRTETAGILVLSILMYTLGDVG